MGVNSRQRRQKKKAKRDHRRRAEASAGRAQHDISGAISWQFGVAMAVREAAEAVFHQRDDAAELVGLLVSGPPVAGGRRMVARELEEVLVDEVLAMASGHWRPNEIVRQVRRRSGAGGEQVVLSVIHKAWRRRGDGAAGPGWAAEAAVLDPGSREVDAGAVSWPADVEVAIGVLGLLAHLPALPECRSTGASDGRSGPATEQGRVLEKVRHLLSKAESTGFPEEAEALTAKAQLLQVVAQVNRCRSVLTEPLGLATVAGHDDDLDTVETLFTSLLVQATTQMTAAGSRTDGAGRSRTRSFRRSFLVAFAVRIGQRLRLAAEDTVAAATAAHGQALVPVLASREEAADEAIAELFPGLAWRGSQAADREGWMAGTLAADLASFGVQPELFEEVA